MVISVQEARELLGDAAAGMSDTQIEEVVGTLGLISKQSLQDAHKKQLKEDATAMAYLLYNIYTDHRLPRKKVADNRGE